jgi:hypothetical protein
MCAVYVCTTSGVMQLIDATRRNMEETQLTSLDFSFNLIQFKAKMRRFAPILSYEIVRLLVRDKMHTYILT